MSPSPPPVRRIGPGVPYADGAEDRLLEILLAANDRSSGSDELAASIVDWPTQYHLSPQRADLFGPLVIAPGTRVLDVGAGTGTAARALGERGASVLALEGNLQRAQAAATRCEDLPDVEVLCGALGDLEGDERFDLVLLIGVLEYAGAALGGSGGAPEMLARARSLLTDGGALVVAIENQLGLKYLLGGAEDHRGTPWTGLDDYPGPPGVRTWTRRELAAMLRDADLPHQRWLAPFPDYKLPSVILDESLYAEPDVAEVVDQILATPMKAEDHEPARLADAAAAHGVLLRAGLGLDVASSFLVVAAPNPETPARYVAPDVLAWLFTSRRRAQWRRRRALTADRVLAPIGAGIAASDEWLSRAADAPRAYRPGRTLEQDIVAAVRAHDHGGLGAALRRWSDLLDEHAVPADGAAGGHPFLTARTTRVLPDGWLDASPANFVDHDGEVVLIDDEWRTGAPVDVELVRLRALWTLARDLLTRGIEHPWGDSATLGEVFDALLAAGGIEADESTVDAVHAAEVELQRLVSGTPAAMVHAWFDPSLRSLDLRRDRRDAVTLAEARQRVGELEQQVTDLTSRTALGHARAALAHITPLRRAVHYVRRR